MMRLFFSKQEGTFYTNDHVECDMCKNTQNNMFFKVIFTSKKSRVENIYCQKCVKDIPENPYLTKSVKTITVSYDLPKDAVPVINDRVETGFGKSNLTVFDVANRQIDNEQVIDRTVHANRKSFEGAKIGHVDMALLEEKDKQIGFDEAQSKLKDLFEAEIEYDDKDRLEFHGGKKDE